jgi:hypothetical protein
MNRSLFTKTSEKRGNRGQKNPFWDNLKILPFYSPPVSCVNRRN